MADITKINLKGTLLTIKDQYAYHNGDLATVATSGSYNDLEDKPDIAAAQVNSDWNATSGVAQILNKPDIPEDLGDLTNNAGYTKNTGTITGITMNGASKGTSGVVNLGTVITAHQDISGKANKSELATVATSGSYNDLSNKPSIPDTSTFATKSELSSKQNTINDLASIRINSGKGVADMSSNSDGTVVYTLANGDTYTLDLNHEHPQYVESEDLADVATSGSYNDLQDKPTIPSGVIVDSTIAQGGTNAVQGGAIYTALQDKANVSEMAVSTSGDQTTITLKTGTSATVINQHQSLSGYAKYVLLADDAAYEALTTKDSSTLYLIPES